jgi:hypothetical protein
MATLMMSRRECTMWCTWPRDRANDRRQAMQVSQGTTTSQKQDTTQICTAGRVGQM